MTEEQVTKALLSWLKEGGWDIVCFDFPQSGTGKPLHPNDRTSKTKGIIIPDIIAVKDGIVIDFENKDRFVLSDVEKVKMLRETDEYSNDLNRLLKGHVYSSIYYGIGMPYSEKNLLKAEAHLTEVDFAVFLKEDGSVVTTGDKAIVFHETQEDEETSHTQHLIS